MTKGDWDIRIYANIPGNTDWLKSLGVLQRMNTERITPIAEMQIWGDANAEALNFNAEDVFADNLGYILESRALQQALWDELQTLDVDVMIGAEGASVELFGSDGTSLSATTGADGLYTYELKANVKYKISASFTGYLTKFHELSTVGIEEDKDFTKDFDFPLKSTKKPITVPMVFYDLNKSTLRAESKTALDGLIKTLTENPTLTIKLTSHTDYRADDKYNMDLSNRRAKSVMDYLVANGIPSDRLTFEGKGETTPKSVENDEEYNPFKRGDVLTQEFIDGLATKELKEEAHQYNRRTEFEVTGATYVPKN
jgi:peptidoglycan-associated lipoprotein